MKICAFDVETSGSLHEHALQPWRVRQGRAWLTSLAWVWRNENMTQHAGSVTLCDTCRRRVIYDMLTWVQDNQIDYLVGWNVVFDIGWLYAYAENDSELLKL